MLIMDYLTLGEASLELGMDVFDVARLINERNIDYRIYGRQVLFALEDIFDEQYRCLQAGERLREECLARMVDFYVDAFEREANTRAYDKLTKIKKYLMEEHTGLYDYITDICDDLFYEIEFYGNEPCEIWFKRIESYEQQPNPGCSIISLEEFEYSYGLPGKKEPPSLNEMKRKANAIVRQVSKFFGMDLPTQITTSRERRNYASIYYKSSGHLAEMEEAA